MRSKNIFILFLWFIYSAHHYRRLECCVGWTVVRWYNRKKKRYHRLVCIYLLSAFIFWCIIMGDENRFDLLAWTIFDLFYFSACGAQLDNFALKLENFQALSNLATRQENGRNLYLNYIFARYVTSETAEEQLWWLFDGEDSPRGLILDSSDNQKGLRSWIETNDRTRAIPLAEVLAHFGTFLSRDSSTIFK